jgi:hypothetical protein
MPPTNERPADAITFETAAEHEELRAILRELLPKSRDSIARAVPMSCLIAQAVVAGCLSTAAGAANLVPDPGFDQQELVGWEPSGPASVEWSLFDELGIPASGSMRVFDSGFSTLEVSRCVAVTGGTAYAFGAGARLPELPRVERWASTAVRWYAQRHCDGPALTPPGTGAGAVTVSQGDSWGTVEGWGTAPAAAASARFVLVTAAVAGAAASEVLFDNAFFVEDSTCVATPTVLCLSRGRFLVTAEWSSRHFAGGHGRTAPLTDDSGYFTFFEGENVELLVKLLDACSTPFHDFWFFAAGLTDIATTIRVHDTRGGGVRTYTSPLEEPFEPIQDTSAFFTCP